MLYNRQCFYVTGLLLQIPDIFSKWPSYRSIGSASFVQCSKIFALTLSYCQSTHSATCFYPICKITWSTLFMIRTKACIMLKWNWNPSIGTWTSLQVLTFILSIVTGGSIACAFSFTFLPRLT